MKDLLSEWTSGKDAPGQLDRFRDAHADDAAVELIAPKLTSAATKKTLWHPVDVPSPTTLKDELKADVLYERVAKSVYVVIAAPSKRAMRSRDGVAQGSAVAVDKATPITNCHIVEGRPDVKVLVSGRFASAEVIAANFTADTCVLSIAGASLVPVVGTRRAATLRVGEDVYAIGSPRGFTNSISKGLISQMRVDSARRLVQTTAQISGGSSGGGLFDRFGNLIGVTTFKIVDAEGLNFAIAVDEFIVSRQ